jgi:DNA mismatch repair ATPase MutS
MGASDNILKGRSTFFVELQETSFILQVRTSLYSSYVAVS